MKHIDQTSTSSGSFSTDEVTLVSVELEALDEVAGGCAACGTAQAPGQAPAAGPAAMAPALLSAFAQR